MDTEIEDDSETLTTQAPKNRQLRKIKRKECTSPEDANKETKRRKEVVISPSTKQDEPPSDGNWETVGKKKKKKQSKKSQPRTRQNALIIRPSEKDKYSDILKRVKQDASAEQVSQYVDKIRRTTAGDMLLILTKDNEDKAPEMQNTLAGILGNDASVVRKVPETDVEIRDLDETTTKQEILDALQRAAGPDHTITLEAVKSLRKAYGGTQTAAVRLEAALATKIIGEHDKIKIGWVNCRIRKDERPTKCFKCWRYGHVASKCSSAVNRSNLCIKCGRSGHKITDCKHDATCLLCAEDNSTESCAHIAGCGKCPVFRKALQMVRKKRL